jgi:hypothetical protein
MLAKVRPLLFWISKDDVGGAKVSWRGSEDGGFGLDLLIGSDPRRAPRQINKWGYIAEQVRGTDARVLGVMKQSNEQTVADAEKALGAEGKGGYVFRAIQGTASNREARAGVTTVRVERDMTYRDIDPLIALVNGATDPTAENRRWRCRPALGRASWSRCRSSSSRASRATASKRRRSRPRSSR